MLCYPSTFVSSLTFAGGAFGYQYLLWEQLAGPRGSWEKWLKFVTSGAREELECLNLLVAAKNLVSIGNKPENVNIFH